jgi:3-hydroxy acid dehydrogenase/malonic semialdehyde reductase
MIFDQFRLIYFKFTHLNSLLMNPKTVIITGASSGIGKACALKFASTGWNLVLAARRIEKLEQLSAEIEQQFKVVVHPFALDVTNSLSGTILVQFLEQHKIVPQLLLNNAGLAVGLNPIQDGLIDDWERMIDTNLKGLLYISRAIAPIFVENKKGQIINIGSIAGKEAYPNGNVYVATKYAVDGLTRAMRMDLLPYGIRVTQIAPGAVETEFSVVRFKGDQQRADNVYKGFKPLSGEDVANAVFYAATVPEHVNINDIIIMPTAQASATQFKRDS